ncbi:recombinase family protein [Nonomuraea sediminis]|uniref:recombinase family protein n=1 Tax=Nonomuraea sediminis TaxID=2835864 RepID=UPI001BDC49FF|nr:recombinase family protein [Nonomuraea sediminis]
MLLKAAETIRAAIYVRISDDREGRGLGVQRQEEDCRELAVRLDWPVIDIYPDNDLSAYSGKPRPQYERMMADIAAGRINAIISWHNDRLHRSPLELEHFIALIEKHSVKVQTVRAGEIDMNTASGRMVARQHGVYARYESEHKSERIRRKIQQLVEDGDVSNGGPRPFGYTRIYAGDGPRRKILRDEINEAEAAIVRECAERVLSGESVRSVVADLNERGIRTSMDNPWSLQALRWLLRSGRIAGLREFHREVVGKANWPAIIDEDTHRRLRALLQSKGRHPGQGPRKYYLTGLVFCSCDERKPKAMRVSIGHGKPKYSCQPKVEGGCGGRVIDLTDLETFIRKWIIKRAGDTQTLRELAEREAASQDDTEGVLTAIQKDEARLQVLEAQLASDGDEDEDELIEVVAAVRKVRARLRRHRDNLARLAGATPLIGVDIADLTRRWDSPDGIGLDRKRALARLFIERVIIHPTNIRGRFDYKRVEIIPVL